MLNLKLQAACLFIIIYILMDDAEVEENKL